MTLTATSNGQQIIDYWVDQARINNDRPTHVTITRRELGELIGVMQTETDRWRDQAVHLEHVVQMYQGLK